MAEKGEHFTGLGDCKIHTSRSSTKCNTVAGGKVYKGSTGCDHQDNCDKPTVTWKDDLQWIWGEEWESHHVLCISCVNKYQVLKALEEKQIQNIAAIYRETPWCINQEPNLVALPMTYVYKEYDDSRALDLPCHEWDHNNTGGYTDEVSTRLYSEVWEKIKEISDKKEQCKIAKNVVQKQLTDLAAIFKQLLEGRGKRPAGKNKGTQAAWNEGVKQNKKDRAGQWWFSFSMASNAVAAVREPYSFMKPKWSSAVERLKLRQKFNTVRDKR